MMMPLGSIVQKRPRRQRCWEKQPTLRRSYHQSLPCSSVTLRQWGKRSAAISLSSEQPSQNVSPFTRSKPGECLHWPIMFWAPCTALYPPTKPIRASLWWRCTREPHLQTTRQSADRRRLSMMQLLSAGYSQKLLKSTRMITSTSTSSRTNAAISDSLSHEHLQQQQQLRATIKDSSPNTYRRPTKIHSASMLSRWSLKRTVPRFIKSLLINNSKSSIKS